MWEQKESLPSSHSSQSISHSLGLLVKGFWFCTLFVVMESRLACSHCMGRSQFPWHGLEQGADRVVVMSK